MDISLVNGWHVTIFHPWLWFAAVVCVLLLCGYLLKIVVAAATRAN